MQDSTGQLSTHDRIEVFFEALRGLNTTPHIAEDAKQTVDILREILGQVDPRAVVVAGLPAAPKMLVESALKGIKHRFVENLEPVDALPVIAKADVGITWAEFGAAKNGAIVEVTYDDAAKLASSLPYTHVALISSKSLLPDLSAAILKVGETVRSAGLRKPVVSIISGPSKTADIELRLIYGVHGPHTLHVLVLDWI